MHLPAFPDLNLLSFLKSDKNLNNPQQIHCFSIQCYMDKTQILHESVHELERETTGTTSEVGPQNAERAFLKWLENNKAMVTAKFPQIFGSWAPNSTQIR